MIHAIPLEDWVIDILILKRELNIEIHFKITLRLTNQTEVAVVDQDLNIGQTELSTNGEFFNQELEIIVAREPHNRAGGIGRDHTECGGYRPAQGACLAAVNPLSRAEDV